MYLLIQLFNEVTRIFWNGVGLLCVEWDFKPYSVCQSSWGMITQSVHLTYTCGTQNYGINLADSQPKWVGLVWGLAATRGHPVLSLHSSNEPGELSQWLCHDDSTINIVVVIIIIIITWRAEGLWHMCRQGPVIEQCTDSVVFPRVNLMYLF